MGPGDVRGIQAGAFGKKNLVPVEQLGLLGLLHQSRPVVGMGDFDQRLRSFPDALSGQVRDAVLGGHDVHRLPERKQTGAALDVQYDARLACAIPAGKPENRQAAVGDFRAVDEIQWPRRVLPRHFSFPCEGRFFR